jgi:non-canonical poly(A) RNA polymerase PAPD5/7
MCAQCEDDTCTSFLVRISNRGDCAIILTGPSMKPSHTRLTCRAHNRFSPSIVLWQHFVSPDRPCLAQLRLSSTTSGATKDGPNEQDGISHPQESNEPTQREAENPHKENVQSNPPRLRLRKPRATKGSDKWHDNKVDASVAKNLRTRYNAQKAEMSASGQLLATARAAFKTGEDYTGVVVRPIITPGSPNIPPNLPWSLPQDERHMGGIDR